jgi:hypothetical protein
MGMSFNNSVKNWEGQVIGFRCIVCDEIKSKMWGNICNACSEKKRQHLEMLEAIKNGQRA